MDIQPRLEELANAYAAGDLNELELAALQEQALATMADSIGAGEAWDAQQAPTAPNSAALAVGQVIGADAQQMRLIHRLDAHGHLWLARNLSAQGGTDPRQQFRALKIFPPTGYEGGSRADAIGLRSYLAKLRARVELASKLEHPGIARIYSWQQGNDGWPYAEMEYLGAQQGQTLAQYLDALGEQPLTWEMIAPWLRQIANALDYAHQEQRLAHQHLDADTVFITEQGVVRLLSFGLAHEIREPRSVLFSAGAPHREAADGAAEAVSPETTYRRDVFALALLIYRLLTGNSVIEAQAKSPGIVPRPAQLTDAAWQVLRRGLAYPSELCPSVAGRFVYELEVAQNPELAPLAVVKAAPQLQWLWGGIAGAVLLLGIAGYWLVRQPPTPTTPSATTQPAVEEGTSLQDAEREVDEKAFSAASRVHTVAAYSLYLQRCPQCAYGKQARAAIQQLETESKIAALQTGLEVAITAFEAGHVERGDEALARLQALAELAPQDPLLTTTRQRLVQGWVKLALASLNKPDPDAARKWLRKIEELEPDSPQLSAMYEALKQAEVMQLRKQTDTEAFGVAKRINTRQAYWSYLDRCTTSCVHRAEAEAALARLAPPYPVLRDRLADGTVGPEMVQLPSAEFQMGSPASESGRYSDERIRTVRIAEPFAIGKYEITFDEYDKFAQASGRPLPEDRGWGRGRRPVIHVDWKSAVAYTEWLSKQSRQRYRLPTESEWEYAIRAGTVTSRYWGEDADQGCAYANAADLDGKQVFVGWPAMKCRDGYVYTAPVGSFRSNEFGLHDMAGNVLEWTCSNYTKDGKTPVQSCQEPDSSQEMVVRGGSWSDEPRNVRSAERHRSRVDFHEYFLGFRVVRELP